MAGVNLVFQAAEAPRRDRGDIYFYSRDLRFRKNLSNSLRKTAGKSVTDSGYVYITQ